MGGVKSHVSNRSDIQVSLSQTVIYIFEPITNIKSNHQKSPVIINC